jgi:single-strand DNA-binding protein
MYSKTIIVGRLGKDPEKRFTPEGKAVTSFSVAVDSGKDKTTWFRVSAWDKLADLCDEYLSKGKLVLVEGVLTADASGGPRVWKTAEGEARASFELLAKEVKFLSPKEGAQEDY